MNDELTAYLDKVGAELDQAWQRRYRATRWEYLSRGRFARVAAFAVVAAAVAVVSVMRTGSPDAAAEAAAAVGLSPANSIVYFVSVTTSADGVVEQRTEMWAATDPPYGRRTILAGDGSRPIEQSSSGNSVSQYDPASGTVFVRTIDGGTAEGTRPADVAPEAVQVRAFLKSSDARDEGTSVVAGTEVRRFSFVSARLGSCRYVVNASSYYALELTCTDVTGGKISEHWDYLSRAKSEGLLSVRAQHPQAHVDVAPMGLCLQGRHNAGTPPCSVQAPGA
jgi:hypothetical protein